jgi:hypothetical protein
MSDDVPLGLYDKLSHSTRDAAQDAATLDALAQWVKAQSDADDAVEAAHNCLFEIAKSPALFVAAAARWVASDEHAVLGRALVHEVSVRHLATSKIIPYDMTGVPESDAIQAAFRLCASGNATAVSLGWVLSLARDFPESPHAQMAVSTLLSYLAEQLPGATHRLLRSDASTLKDLPAAQQTLARLDGMNAIIAQLPVLRELAMTPAMRLAHASFKRSENRDIQRSARESSLLRYLATEFHFKYANRTTIEMGLGDLMRETPMMMDAHHLSMELPLSEVTDPLYGKLNRLRLAEGLPK